MCFQSLRRIIGFSALLTLDTYLAGAERANIHGRVVTDAGTPVEHATVMVYAAGVKHGYSTYCPTCYPDCGKRRFTDAQGAFTIQRLNSDLWFRLLIVREGYRATFVQKLDPSEGPTRDIVLKLRPVVDDPARVIRGLVVDTNGKPLRDAIVQPEGVAELDPQGRVRQIFGSPPGLEPLAVTNQKGEFEIAHGKPASSMVLVVEARGMAPKKLLEVRTGADRQTIVLDEGAVVRGRLMQGERPVTDAEIGMFSTNHINGSGYDEIRVGTGEDGSFVFTNVPTPVEWHVYGKMQSLASRGAVQPLKIATKKDHEDLDLGNIQIVKGHRLQGRVILSDGKPVPDGMRIFVTPACMSCGEEVSYKSPTGRTLTMRSFGLKDAQTVALGEDGRFEFNGLASGPYQLTAAVKGYGLASGYVLLRPQDQKLDEEAWKRSSELNSSTLRMMNTVEIRVENDLKDVVVNLDPVSPSRAN